MKKILRNFRNVFILFYISVIVMLASNVYAEDNSSMDSVSSDTRPWWVNLGTGVAGSHDSSDNIGGYTATASINFPVFQYQLMTVDYIQTDQFLGASSVKEVGLLYGLIARQKYGYESASAGLSWVQYDQGRGGFLVPKEHIATYDTIGIPGELQFFLTPISHFGLGVIIFGNLNNKKSFMGAALALQFGVW